MNETFFGNLRLMDASGYTHGWTKRMKAVAKIGILTLVIVLGGAPLMACMLPWNVMTAQEKACCRRMAHRCGDHTMPSSHSCCKTVGSPEQVAVARSSFRQTPQVDFVYLMHPTVASGDMMHQRVIRSSVPGHSPPENPPASPNVLRI